MPSYLVNGHSPAAVYKKTLLAQSLCQNGFLLSTQYELYKNGNLIFDIPLNLAARKFYQPFR